MAALQEVSMKDCVGYAGILFATKFACGARFLNLSIWKQERELATWLALLVRPVQAILLFQHSQQIFFI